MCTPIEVEVESCAVVDRNRGGSDPSHGSSGVDLSEGSSVLHDTVVTDGTGFGLDASTSTGCRGNVFTGNNAGGNQVDSGVEIGPNLCGTDTTCP